jgi:hypothetical protein
MIKDPVHEKKPKPIARQGPSRKRKRSRRASVMGRPNVGVTKKDQQPDSIRDAKVVDQPETNYVGVAQDKASPQRVAQVPPVQNLSIIPTHGKSVSWDDKAASSRMRGITHSYHAAGDLVDCSMALLPDKAVGAESLTSEITGNMSKNNGFAKDCTSNSHLSPVPLAITNHDIPDSAKVQESQIKSTAVEPSTEQDAAKIWSRCQQSCSICDTPHLAIPGSHLSETCARISIVLRGTVLSSAHQSQHQIFLVPTEKDELYILGWLIWSTFVHQVALENPEMVVRRGNMPANYYIHTEIGRVKNSITHPMLKTVIRKHHRTKTSFEAWWDGRWNLMRYGGKRWLVITFPWNMGDVNISDASFGAIGPLFTLPILEPAQATVGKVHNKSKRGKCIPNERSESCGSTGESEDEETGHGSGIINAGEKNASKDVVEVEGGNGGIRKAH